MCLKDEISKGSHLIGVAFVFACVNHSGIKRHDPIISSEGLPVVCLAGVEVCEIQIRLRHVMVVGMVADECLKTGERTQQKTRVAPLHTFFQIYKSQSVLT